MIGLVIVSHSAQLAAGVRELAMQMVHERVPIALAAGIDDPVDPIGTDPLRVVAAIESVYSDDGVLVLMDLGSALLSAETALEFLDPEQQPHVFLCEAPLVEGAMAAAVQIMAGSSLSQVMAEARGALAAKAQQLAPAWQSAAAQPVLDAGVTPDESSLTGAQTLCLTVPKAVAWHARPLAKLIETISEFAADIYVSKAGNLVNARSINRVAMLGARPGDELIFHALGEDAAAALTAIQTLAEANFGERVTRESFVVTPSSGSETANDILASALTGIPASAGIAIGPVALYQSTLPEIVEHTVADPAAEWSRFEAAVQAAVAELQELEAQTAQAGLVEAPIFAAHRLILQDPDLQAVVHQQINVEQHNAEAAWQRAMQALVADYQALDDAYLRERALDARDIGQRVLRHLLNAPLPSLHFEQPVILVADELTPSETAQLDPAKILGIITAQGGATGHSAILARALAIPAVVGAVAVLSRLHAGQIVALDGGTGQIWLTPTPAQVADLQQRRVQWQAKQAADRRAAQQRASTRDQRRIEVAANISNPAEIEQALELGAEGVGLFRTEFLFMGREQMPTEEEQFAAYSTAARALGVYPLIIRTLDVGGDKPISYLGIRPEPNAALGWRGLRYCLDQPAIFKTQLRAILRASAGHSIKLMFPMVSTVEEVQRAKAMVGAVQDELRAARIAFDEAIEIGIMIEVPSAVMLADQLAQAVDFFSIGTNDLTQYLMAADRGNGKVASLVNALQPAVLRAIQQIVQAGHAAGIWVGMCGELAGDLIATPLLLGLGLDELSMNAAAIPQVKARIRQLDMPQAQKVAEQCLALSSTTEIEKQLAVID